MIRAAIASTFSAPQLLRGRALSIVRPDVFALGAIFATVVLVYMPTLDAYFHGDDFLAFTDLTTKPPLRFLGDVITFQDANVYWRPLGQAYFLGLYAAFGLEPFYFHLANLGVFLITLLLLYGFCLRFGLNKAVAIGAMAMFGLFPNHVVSVAWITNGSRLLAVMFVLASLLLLQSGLSKRRWPFEVLAFLAMALAVFSDETAATLTPLPVLYAFLSQPKRWWVGHAVRTFAYGSLGLSITLLQMLIGREDQTAPALIGLSQFDLGWHIPSHFWALASKLVLPLQDGVSFRSITTEQWTAGAFLGGVGMVLLAIGSSRARFLVIWTLLALLPFSLWSVPIVPARYVYMAAVPFAVLCSWALVSLAEAALASRPWRMLSRWRLAPVIGVGVAAALAAAIGLAGQTTLERDEAFAKSTEPYRALAEDLPRILPEIPSGSRIVLYYGVWDGFASWRDAVVQSVYKDTSLKTVSIGWQATEDGVAAAKAGDIIVYYGPNGFIAPALKPK